MLTTLTSRRGFESHPRILTASRQPASHSGPSRGAAAMAGAGARFPRRALCLCHSSEHKVSTNVQPALLKLEHCSWPIDLVFSGPAAPGPAPQGQGSGVLQCIGGHLVCTWRGGILAAPSCPTAKCCCCFYGIRRPSFSKLSDTTELRVFRKSRKVDTMYSRCCRHAKDSAFNELAAPRCCAAASSLSMCSTTFKSCARSPWATCKTDTAITTILHQ